MYLEDIVILSCNAHDHKSHVRTVLSHSYNSGITLYLKKGNFFNEKIVYLGPAIELRKMVLAGHTTDVI